ncbi:hypothetical protein SERLA73DRAFT_69174 [Serpula lacrymans var. lacrymans S7.3]|uniref:Uncharacterized protein n=2 Tax=Serpula lacrymans var. lacrymans TaxID=341189 RepID=F8PK32_SERL3|nr:uncharacterized protein SERLADRAFT_433065 [Serpula lacrymans var. lacrymans S7.9]EGO03272.1 hypothetical protein SERLA73DRAFT_69174 [Serpula lacrymans var. lacrymans S7.3]EGO29053.1 hypothetical protein SERLADRAFT_433065 [Serpula lacrymans var. lacrymans S7.9]
MSIHCIMKWMITGSHQKSEREVTQLVRDIILAPDFNVKDLHSFNARHANQVFDQSNSPSNDPFTYDGWKESEVNICIPTRTMDANGNGKVFSIPHFRYCPITSGPSIGPFRGLCKGASSVFFQTVLGSSLWWP